MHVLLAFIFVFISSVVAVSLAALLLVVREGSREGLVAGLVGYACGILLGATFLGLLPSALQKGGTREVLFTVLVGIVVFFLIERLFVWHHCHRSDCTAHQTAGPLILIGDGVHNFVDGVLIATAFQVSPALGITTSLAVLAHEVPQELGDFAILLSSGYSPRTALLLNTISSLSAILGAVLAFLVPLERLSLIPYVIALAAASFLYIAIADLIPGLHHRSGHRMEVGQIALLLAGIVTMWVLVYLIH